MKSVDCEALYVRSDARSCGQQIRLCRQGLMTRLVSTLVDVESESDPEAAWRSGRTGQGNSSSKVSICSEVRSGGFLNRVDKLFSIVNASIEIGILDKEFGRKRRKSNNGCAKRIHGNVVLESGHIGAKTWRLIGARPHFYMRKILVAVSLDRACEQRSFVRTTELSLHVERQRDWWYDKEIDRMIGKNKDCPN